MSRKRSARAANNRRPKPAPNHGQRANPAPPVSADGRSRAGMMRVGLAVLLGVGALLLALRLFSAPATTPYVRGSVTNCNTTQPAFARTLGFSRDAVLDTRSNVVEGIALYEVDPQGNILRAHQDPSWTSGGYLGRPVLDGESNVYVVPVPAINTWLNPVEKANTIYRIDAETGVMSALIDLPAGAPSNDENPYGLLSLGYDCETNSLYAASVYGSDRLTQAGRIFQINLTSGRVQSQWNEVDAFGLAVFNAAQGKRLYFGLARQPRILSIGLDAQGNLNGDVREEFVLSYFGANTDQRVRSIRFLGADRMQIRTVQFSFNLVAPTEVRESLLEYVYDAANDTWQLDAGNVTDLGL